ncbi:MAG: hypothetical protein JRI47_05710 [Deltaproteobacteria bacterium]|nr:hypothetical protein [Deltaproteobacteria bacterium]
MRFHSLFLNGNRTTIKELLSKSKEGDKVSCRIGDPRFIGIFHEIESRGTDIFPPLLCQNLSLSKIHQALHYVDYMIPNTQVVFRKSHIQNILRDCAEKNILKTVVKEDRSAIGMGDHPCWSLNELARTMIHLAKPPVVVQPMLEEYREIRLLIFRDTVVAKEKTNDANVFWRNRFFGGVAEIIMPDKDVVEFGKEMMDMGKFPWVYMDLFVTGDGIYLSEINLSGSNAGLKEYKLNKMKNRITRAWLSNK